MSKTCNSLWTTLMAVVLNLSYSVVRRQNPCRRITRRQLLLCVICGACALWLSNFLFMIAYRYLSVPETTMLHFLHPAMIAVFMTVFFHERFSLAKLAAIICSILSMILIAGGIPSGSTVGILAATLTGVCYESYPVLLEVSPLKNLPANTVLLYMNLSGALCALTVSLVTGNFSLPITPMVWGIDVAMAAISFFAYLLSCYAVHVLGATNTSFGAMLEPIASCVIAALFLGERMGANVLYGGILVVLSVFFCSLNNHGGGEHRRAYHLQNRVCEEEKN